MEYNLFDIRFWHFDYASPWWFLLFLAVPLLTWFYIWRNVKRDFSVKSGATYTSGRIVFGLEWLKHLLFGLKMLAVVLFVLALSQPYSSADHKNFIKKNFEGIDIVVSMDVSGSMLAMDFKPNRLEASKSVVIDFLDNRINDRIGLVVYEGEAYTKCPLTTDYKILKEIIPTLGPGRMTQGTAIGTGLATAVNRLRDSKAKSKVVILLSDGANNSGEITPLNASEIAKEFGIKVYTIGIGKSGLVPFPNGQGGVGYMQSDLDEGTLKEIAKKTDGTYFRAENEEALREIYDEIELLEKTEIKSMEFQTEPPSQHFGFVFIGMLLIVLAFILESTVLKRITH
jgi:Ca-activated chloride channel family protein